MFPVSLYTSVIKQCERTLEMSVCHPILQVGLLLKHLQLKVLQLILFTVVRRPDSGVPHLRVLGCKLERRHKWTEFGGHLRSWWTFVYLTKASYNRAQFVTTDSFCSKEAEIWSGTDVNSFSLSSVWTTATKCTELIILRATCKIQICTFPSLFSELIDVVPISFLRAKAIARTNQQETYRHIIISWSIRGTLKNTNWDGHKSLSF